MAKFLTPEPGRLFAKKLTERHSGKYRDQYELTYFHGVTGKPVHIMVNVSPIFGDEGKLLYSLGMVSEITELKRVQNELDLNVNRLKKAQKMAHLGFWEWSILTDEIWWSDEIYSIFAIDAAPRNIDGYFRLLHPEDAHKVRETRLRGIETGASYRSQYRIIRPNGEIRHCLNHVEIEVGEDGRPVKFIGTIQDITEQVKKNALMEEQRAKMIASSKLSTLGEMAGGVAHEINTPLAVVMLNAQSLLRDVSQRFEADSSVIRRVKKIISVTDRIGKIVSGLRAFSRCGDQDPFVPERLQKIVDETLQLCQEKFKNSGVEIQVSEFNRNLMIECRATQVSQVLLNLLNNAYDAVSNQAEKWIRVRVEEKPECIEFSVIDSGPGISASVRDKIFIPFFTTKEIGQGTGLGLSTSKGLVEDHRGSMWIDFQNPNTCFVFRLPLRQVSENFLTARHRFALSGNERIPNASRSVHHCDP